MRSEDDLSPRQDEHAPRPLALAIAVPYADENRNHALLSEWRRQGGELLPPPPLTLPRRSEGTYEVRLRKRIMGGFFVEEQYSDAIAGITGGRGGHLEGLVVTHMTFSGERRFTSAHRTFTARAGQLCVRRNDEPWDFEVARGTRGIAMAVPGEDVRFPPHARALTAEQDSPAAQLLLAHLRLWTALYDDLDAAARSGARNAALELFHGLLNSRVIDDPELSPALARAAMECIEDRLLSDPDLSPRTIADALHVSVRTLYRAFADQPTSVMGYVRERRLERARAELASTPLTVSELAARWHFTDSSHFTRAYKKRFGETPAARRRD